MGRGRPTAGDPGKYHRICGLGEVKVRWAHAGLPVTSSFKLCADLLCSRCTAAHEREYMPSRRGRNAQVATVWSSIA